MADGYNQQQGFSQPIPTYAYAPQQVPPQAPQQQQFPAQMGYPNVMYNPSTYSSSAPEGTSTSYPQQQQQYPPPFAEPPPMTDVPLKNYEKGTFVDDDNQQPPPYDPTTSHGAVGDPCGWINDGWQLYKAEWKVYTLASLLITGVPIVRKYLYLQL